MAFSESSEIGRGWPCWKKNQHDLKEKLVEFATLVEHMIHKSTRGLLEKKRDLLIEVMEEEEPKADKLELEMDELCTSLIAQFEPKAKDLRIILMGAKMCNDLERMGDHAVNIAESVFLIERP